MLEHLAQYIGEDQFNNINVDFELSVMNSIKSVFKNTQVTGCYFHFLKANKMKMRKLAKKKLISRDNFFKRGEKFLSCLPSFLPMRS